MRTFVIRIWHAADEEPSEGLRGTVHDVATGEGKPFVSGAQLLSLLATGVGRPVEQEEPAT